VEHFPAWVLNRAELLGNPSPLPGMHYARLSLGISPDTEADHMKAKEVKRREGAERNAQWTQMSAKEKLASLDARLGKGQGATRQRVKLSTEGA
jgi:hypothetical protein